MEENEKLREPHPAENNPKEIPNVNGTDETVMSQTGPATAQQPQTSNIFKYESTSSLT